MDSMTHTAKGSVVIHNLKVVHSREGWDAAEALKAVADAKTGVRYPMGWANVPAGSNRHLLAGA